MKFKVYSKKAAENAEKGQLFFKLKESKGNAIGLIVVDKNGDIIKSGNALAYDNDFNCFILPDSFNENIGIKTDGFGHVVFHKVSEMKEYIKPEKSTIRLDELLDKILK